MQRRHREKTLKTTEIRWKKYRPKMIQVQTWNPYPRVPTPHWSGCTIYLHERLSSWTRNKLMVNGRDGGRRSTKKPLQLGVDTTNRPIGIRRVSPSSYHRLDILRGQRGYVKVIRAIPNLEGRKRNQQSIFRMVGYFSPLHDNGRNRLRKPFASKHRRSFSKLELGKEN